MTAITTKNAGTLHQISPTVLSSDLFTPLREPRVTLPTIGVHIRDIPQQGAQPWGGCLTTYGGTGGLPFLGSYRVRDLQLGRSHRHFGSGLSFHPTTTQPYRLTDLKLSDCRTNDQRLTTSLKADGVSSTWQREAWPGHHPYFSHRSIFEVFPTGVSLGSDENDPKGHSDEVVSPTTLLALKKVQEKLYQQTLYRDSFDKQISKSTSTDTSREHLMAVSPPNYCCNVYDKCTQMERDDGTVSKEEEDVPRDVPRCDKTRMKTKDDEEDEDEESKEEAEEKEEESRKIDNESEILDDTSPCDDDVELYKSKIKESVKSLLDKLSQQRKERERLGYPPLPKASQLEKRNPTPIPPPPPPKGFLPPCLLPSSRPRSSKTRPDGAKPGIYQESNSCSSKLTYVSGSPVSGVGPCWPPSTSHVIDNIRGSQLLERRELSEFPEAYLSTLEPRSTVKKGTSICDTVESLHPEPPPSPIKPELYSEFGQLPTARLKKGGAAISSTFFDNFPMAFSACQRQGNSREGTAILRRPNGDILYLPPVPLSECLTPSGSKIPHKLGLRFKTEAHRRYHAIHQEEVPDLRSTRNWGKKYFFFDYHSSALRG